MNNFLKAIIKICDETHYYGVYDDIVADFFTHNVTRSGRDVLWYNDGCGTDCCIYLDTLEFLSEEEEERELC